LAGSGRVILWNLHNKHKEKAVKKQVVRSPVVAAVSSAVTIGIWTGIAPASARGSMPALVHPDSSQQVISDVSLHDAYSAEVTVDPGDNASAVAECSNGEKAVGGGYIISGTEGLTVASAVKSYPSKVSADPNGYGVEVVNPSAASGPVTFTVKAVCLGFSVTTVH
jgi:cytoskeletal protein RodZ